jgi:NCS2 family nucleobase:cation symporter-2
MTQPSRHPVDDRLPLARRSVLGLQHVFRNNRFNLYIVALSIGFGLIPLVAPRWAQQMAHSLHPLLESGILPTAVAAVALNLFFNGTRDIPAESHGDAGATNNHQPIVQGSKA